MTALRQRYQPAHAGATRAVRVPSCVALVLGAALAVAMTSGSGTRQANADPPRPPAVVDPTPVRATATATAAQLGQLAGPVGSGSDPRGPAVPGLPPGTDPAVSGLAADGIPVVALDAYRRAASSVAESDPGCGLPWQLLAAIGRVESDHGRFGDAVIHADGTSTPKIIGIALDGSRSATILDTDRGRLDGDPVFDRAVGPMQFIPSTWAAYGVDGNGDGVVTPFSLYDAALAAAHYLCAAGGDLRAVAGQARAVLAYNQSDSYLSMVLALAAAYAGTAPVAVPMQSAPIASPAFPPVNPGPPPAVHTSAGPDSAMHSPASGPSTWPTTPGTPPVTSPPSQPASSQPATSAPAQPSTTPTPTSSTPTAPGTPSCPSTTPTATASPIPMPSANPTPTPTPTPTSSTATSTATPTATPTPIPTATGCPPTPTPTPTPTSTGPPCGPSASPTPTDPAAVPTPVGCPT